MQVTIQAAGLERMAGRLHALGVALGEPLLERIADEVAGQTRTRFETKREPSGRAWKPWSPAYAATRPPGASLLIDTGALLQSIETAVAGERVELLARRPYAGAVQGPRPYLGIGQNDAAELTRAIEQHVTEALHAG